jgi:hypothetical protein
MADFDFPTSPSDGQTYIENGRIFEYNSAKQRWESLTTTGAQGIQGIQGTGGVGQQGVQGTDGAFAGQGIQGTAGEQGIQGIAGAFAGQGVQGVVGEQGIQGITGSQGIQGITGSQGAQGIQGIDGTLGSQGEQGIQGIQGITGAQGVQGIQGITGTGAQGIQGITGAQGVQGIQGITGTEGARYFTVTNSGASAYVIDGVNNPDLKLLRGFTYIFDVNAPGHPFYIKTAPTIGTTNQYTTGVTNNGEDVGLVTFSVPSDAPSTLYYQCSIHSVMGGELQISDLGPQGIQGITGAQGIQGIQGIAGSQGVQGIQGTAVQGIQGIQGIAGSQGVQGVQGTAVQGIQGIQGVQGIAGVSGTNTVPSAGTKTSSYTLIASDSGDFVTVGTGGSIVIPSGVFSAGEVITIFNNTTGNVTITSSAVTSYISGTNVNVSSVTLFTRGICTILFVASNTCVVSGAVS